MALPPDWHKRPTDQLEELLQTKLNEIVNLQTPLNLLLRQVNEREREAWENGNSLACGLVIVAAGIITAPFTLGIGLAISAAGASLLTYDAYRHFRPSEIPVLTDQTIEGLRRDISDKQNDAALLKAEIDLRAAELERKRKEAEEKRAKQKRNDAPPSNRPDSSPQP